MIRSNVYMVVRLKLIFALAFPIFSHAELGTEVDPLSEKEMVFQEKARKRLFPGGRDEENLIVHPQAIIARRKLSRREVEKEVYKQLFNEDLKANSATEDTDELETEEE